MKTEEDNEKGAVELKEKAQFEPTDAAQEEPSSGPWYLWGMPEWRVTVVFLSCCFTNLIVQSMYSLIGPFYPQEATAKGCDDFLIGLIFATFPFTVFFLSLVCGGFLIRKIGVLPLLYIGLAIEGVGTLLYAALPSVESGAPFIGFSFGIRVIQGIGASASLTAEFAIITRISPKEVIGKSLGTSEFFIGIGLMIGPPVGGALYEAGGFILPFVVFGPVLYLVLFYQILLHNVFMRGLVESHKPSNLDENGEEISSLKILKGLLSLKWVYIVAMVVVCSTASLGFLESTFSLHLTDDYQMSVDIIGLLFVLPCLVYALSALAMGFLADKLGRRKIMLVGLLLTALGYLLIGPTPLWTDEKLLWMVILGELILGVGVGASLFPTFPDLVVVGSQLGDEAKETISGIVNSASALGSIIGPIFGSAVSGSIGFDWGATIFSAVCALCAAVLFVFMVMQAMYDKAINRKNQPQPPPQTAFPTSIAVPVAASSAPVISQLSQSSMTNMRSKKSQNNWRLTSPGTTRGGMYLRGLGRM